MLHSTRSLNEVSVSKAILKGLASDGGLFIFDDIKKIDINDFYILEYKEIAFKIFKLYLDEFSEEEIKWAIDNAYSTKNFGEEIVSVKDFKDYAFLELFNGPTSSFKDMALTILPKFMYLSKKKNNINELTHIYVATSGDTGSATLSGFNNIDGIDVTVLYPDNLVSKLQEKQMLYFSNEKSRAYAVNGNFDDCQRIVKEIAMRNKKISSANSINIGRLIPQIVYYFYGYVILVKLGKIKKGEEIDVCVPTGNFGNILAGYIAKQMKVPINKLICASNENNVLYDFINTGVYDRNRKFIKTYAPSMDILVSSNMERLIYYALKDCDKVRELFDEFKKNGIIKLDKEIFKDFISFFATNDEILKEIENEYKDHDYLIDPHTAVALNVYKKAKVDKYTLIVSTASCYKFEDAMNKCNVKFDMKNAINSISKIMNVEISEEIKNNKKNEEEIMEMVRCLK